MLYAGYENPVTGNAVYCHCDECPLGDGDAVRRYERLYRDFGEWQPDHLGCDKVGLPFFAGGCCDDAFSELPNGSDRKEKNDRSRADRRKNEHRAFERKKETMKATKYKSTALGWIDDGGVYFKHQKNSKRKRFLKTQANRRIRRMRCGAECGRGYRKQFDLAWNLD